MCMHLHFDCIGIQTDINLLKEQMLPSEDTIAAGEISGTKWNEAPTYYEPSYSALYFCSFQ